jgi:methanogenic corrinoid protein MtbC1
MSATGHFVITHGRAPDHGAGALAMPFGRPPLASWPDEMPPQPRAGDTRALLAAIVQREVLPRLVQVQRLRPGPATASLSAATIASFATLLLASDVGPACTFAERVGAESAGDAGANMRRLHLGLLAPTARYLGHLWEIDELHFTEVTIGLGRLHQVLRTLGSARHANLPPRTDRLAVLLAPVGEQHSFGLAMVRDFFRHAAWNVWSDAPANDRELCTLVHDNRVAVLGFSVAGVERLEAVRCSIVAARRASWNRRIGIMVGGPAFIAHPERVAQVGADVMALDGEDAVRQAEHLVTGATPRN